ncbi:MAG TPA: cytochrome b/b6 domain-containing protein [Microbacteriaceae bacterium]|nr:cytochrome b/b6 domain-containing protein [Microbacteriaceae bacterium]
MATYSSQIRQGLPRIAGGEPWPAAGVAPIDVVPVEKVAVIEQKQTPEQEQTPKPAVTQVEETTSAKPVVAATGIIRQGLPRVPGGEPWPAGGVTSAATATATEAVKQDLTEHDLSEQGSLTQQTVETAKTSESEITAKSTSSADSVVTEGAQLRRGLPRVSGGDPWPAAGAVPAWAVKHAADAPAGEQPATVAEPVAAEAAATEAVAAQVSTEKTATVEAETQKTVSAEATPVIDRSPAISKDVDKPVAKTAPPAEPKVEQQVQPKPAPKPAPKPREPIMIGEKTLSSWIKIVVLGVLGAVAAAAILVLAARGVTTLPGVPEFLKKYPGEYDPVAPVDPGFPAWARWSHFLNIFLMVLIIRSGLLVRTQQKPPAFWTPKKGGKKVSINLWLHTSLDVLWVANGVIFVVLLFVSGHWLRIIPTSWEVFPNAASAMLQYMTLDWPTENGWVNYNSLQQLMYFIIIFIAAPLAIITGVRMSEWWPEKAERLNKIYPAPLARALHFPVMLFFVLFILVHVFLVFSTGALRNLNHMFAGTDVVNWTGFWLFALAIALTAAGWFAARPLILAPIANLFGKVSNR